MVPAVSRPSVVAATPPLTVSVCAPEMVTPLANNGPVTVRLATPLSIRSKLPPATNAPTAPMEFPLTRLTASDTPVLLITVPVLINPPPDSATPPPALSRSTVPPVTSAPALISTPPEPAPSRAVPLALTVPLTLIVAALSIVTFTAETVPVTARLATPPSPNVKEPLATLKPFSALTALALPNPTVLPAVPVNVPAVSAAPPTSPIAPMLSNSIATCPRRKHHRRQPRSRSCWRGASALLPHRTATGLRWRRRDRR